MSPRWETYIKRLYNDPKRAGSFTSPLKLYRAIQKEGKHRISLNKIKGWLSKQEVYTLHKSVNRKIKRRKVIVRGIDYQWDYDLGYMDKYAEENNSYKYILLSIDIFSRFVWTRALVRKSGKEVQKALSGIFQEDQRKPKHIRTDKGTEFMDKNVQNFLRRQHIEYFTTDNEVKSNYAERAIKTIKSKLFRYMTVNNTFKWVDALASITLGYNKTYHRSIKMAPRDVTPEIEVKLWMSLYPDTEGETGKRALKNENKTGNPKKTGVVGKKKKRLLKAKLARTTPKFKFMLDDTVRISHARHPFQREYNERWTREHFIIVDRFLKGGIKIYKLKDYDNELITGSFYEQELQKIVVKKNDPYKIQEVLRERTRKRKTEIYVKFLGWPEKFNAWIPKEKIVKLS